MTPFRLTTGDAQPLAALAVERGWLPHEDAWRIALALGTGVGLAAPDGGLAAMALLLPHGPAAGVLSVLVSPRSAGQGTARRLVAAALEGSEASATRAGRRVEIHAPPSGRPFAERLGFRAAGSSTRFVGLCAAAAPAGTVLPGGATLRPVSGTDFPAVVAVDEVAWGANRRPLLEALFGKARRACLAFAGGRTVGYGLAWDDGEQVAVGPVVAEEESVGAAMVAWLVTGAGGLEVRIDVPDERDATLAAAAAAGLTPRGRITRFERGGADAVGRRERIHALAAPWAG